MGLQPRLREKLDVIDARNEKDYGEDERALRQDIRGLEGEIQNSGRVRRTWLKLSRQLKQRQQEIENKRRQLDNIAARKNERRGTVARILEQRNATAAILNDKLKELRQPAPEQERGTERSWAERPGRRTRSAAGGSREKTQDVAYERSSSDTTLGAGVGALFDILRAAGAQGDAPSSSPANEFETSNSQPPTSDFEEAARKYGTTAEYEKVRADRMRQHIRQRKQSRDRDSGPERER